MPRISSPRPLDLTKPFVTSSQSYGSQPFDLSESLVTWYRDIRGGDFVPDLSRRGNRARCGGIGSNDRVTGSNDIPEYNPLNYPIKSFDLRSNDTSPNVQHIRSINDSGTATSYEDHTFTDGTRDIPFSVSFWLKSSDTSGVQYLAAKGAISGTSYEWEIQAGTTLKLRLWSGGAALYYIQAFTPLLPDAWNHFVITYDGSETQNGINIYKDGANAVPTRTLNAPYAGMQNSNLGLCIGTAFSSPSYAVSTSDLRGKIHSFAIWKNRVISLSEASSLYYAYINGPGGEARSGFISRSPRLLLQELDDHAGSYSTVQRAGDTSRHGSLVTNFDDSATIIFSETGSPVFPSMLPRGNTFNSQAVDILGQESDISITAPIRSAQHPTYLHYSPEEQMGPFNENRVIPATDFFLSGTNPDVMPGFTSPLRSKIAIEIDITPQSDVTITRNVSSRNSAEGQPVSSDNTGFYYFNFSSNEWNEIGKTDPATGGSLYYDFAIDPATGLASGTFPNQFTFGNCTAKEQGATKDNRLELGYSKIGSPTVVMGAPSLPKYHATKSQSLKLSNLISSPFMLEAVTVDFGEIIAQRTNGGATPLSSPSVFKSGSIRDIDNYVFFMYRQNRANRVIDSVSDVSSSNRHLVCSASMTFWNSASLSGSGWSPATLLHSPAFSYEFGLPYNDSYQIGSYTGSVSLNMRPAICGPQQLGVSRVPDHDGIGSEFIQNSWGGGSTLQSVELFGDNAFFVRPFNSASGETLTDVVKRAFKIDSRAIRKFGGESQDQTTENLSGFGFVSITTPQSNESPYLLFPEDEIIFGLEAGIPQLPFANLFSNLTGSHLRVGTKPCKITLFGSMVIDGVEKLSSLNQNLSSNSVHEIVGAETVLDQFQIEPISSYYGSYLDEIVTGSMANPSANTTLFTIFDQDNSRRIISRVSLGQAGTTGSLQRFVKMIDQTERTYDSCLPNFNVMLPSATKTASEYSYISENVPLFTGVEWEQEKDLPESVVLQFPFALNPTRNKQKTIGIVGATYTPPTDVERTTYIASSPADITGRELDNMNVLYKTRYEYVSYAAYNDVYRINRTFYTFETTRPINVTDGLVSYYRLKRTPALEASAIATLEDSIYNNDLTGTPTDGDSVIHTGPKYYKGSPLFPFDPTLALSGRAAFSQFFMAPASANVRYFEDAGDYADHKMVNNVSSPTADVPFSLSCVFYLENLGTTQTLIERRNTTAREYTLEVTAANYLKFYKGRGNTTTDFRSVLANASGADLDADTWHHVLVTYNGVDSNSGDNVKIYINGVLQTTKTLSYNGSVARMNTSSSSRLRLGTGMKAGGTGIIPDQGTEITNGRIFSVGIWKNKELSAQDANDLYQAELVGSCVGNVRHRIGTVDSFIGKAPAFRYGISNIDPEFSSARWNATSFGQPRDMLESRLGITTSDGTPPVKIHFVSGSTYNANPNNTHAQNLSAFATSSIPWIDDGLFRNREDNPDETLLII